MKKTITSLTLTTALVVAALAAPPSAAPTTDLAPILPSLPRTMMLALEGNLTGIDSGVDLSFAVSGPDFSATTSLTKNDDADNPVRMNFHGTIEVKDERYLVSYNLNWQVPTITTTVTLGNTAAARMQPQVVYRSYELQNSVYLRADKPMVLLSDQGKKLTLEIKTLTEKTAPTASLPSV